MKGGIIIAIVVVVIGLGGLVAFFMISKRQERADPLATGVGGLVGAVSGGVSGVLGAAGNAVNTVVGAGGKVLNAGVDVILAPVTITKKILSAIF